MDERLQIPVERTGSTRRWYRISSWGPGTSWFVLSICLFGTFLVWEITRGQAVDVVAQRFRERAERISQDITNRMLAYDQVLKGAAGLFAASVTVERHEWRDYVRNVGIENNYPGIRGLGFIQYVTRSNRESFLNLTRQDFPANYLIKTFDIRPSGERDDYLVVKFLEPIGKNRNRRAFGVDIGTNAVQRAVAERACDTGEAALSARVTLLQSTNDAPGVLMLRPIYFNNRPHATIDQRRAHIEGWVYAAFLMADLMTNVLRETRADIDFEIFDGYDLSPRSLLYDEDGILYGAEPAPPGVLYTNTSLNIAGRQWTVYFRALPGFARNDQWNKPLFMLIAGLCMSLLFFGITRAITSTRVHAERLAEEITGQFRMQERAIQATTSGVTILDATKPDLPVVYVNPAVERMTGYSADEIKAQKTSIMVDPNGDQKGVEELREAIDQRRAATAEVHCKRKDGTFFWNEVHLAPLPNAHGVVSHFVAISTDITERKRSEQSLKSLTNRLTLATQSAKLGVWDWDIRTDKLVWDEGMYRLYGVSSEKFSGAYAAWETAVHPDDKQRTLEELQQALRGEKDFHTEFRVVWPDNSVHLIEANAVVLRDETTKEAVQMLGINADVTERRRAERELEQARFAAEAASCAKSEFVANMSHEIRTPLNAVIGMTDLALETPLNAEQKKYLTAARQSAGQLLGLMNDILDFSRIEAGRMELNPEPFPLRELLDLWLAPFHLRAREKNLRFELRVHPHVPNSLVGDFVRLRQVLVNLVGNALKFTSEGEILVIVEPDASASDHPALSPAPIASLLFSVADTGIGIPADKQETIFESFTQADSSITRNYGGTGLGLAIARRLVTMMRGKIWVQSEPGRGSRFYFSIALPIAPAAAAIPNIETSPPRELPARLPSVSLRVLVAEDNPVNAELLTTFLNRLGHAVQVAANGHEALAALERDKFDLVFMDVQMPRLDGIKATASIRQREKSTGRHLPIIAVTAYAQGTHDACLKAGMDGYLSKPIDRQELFAAMERCIPGSARETHRVDGAAMHRILAQFNGDVSAARKLVTIFLEFTPALLSELRAALAAGDVELLKQVAHTLKGSVTELGDARCRDAALEVEDRAAAGHPESAVRAAAQLESEIARLTEELRQFLKSSPGAD